MFLMESLRRSRSRPSPSLTATAPITSTSIFNIRSASMALIMLLLDISCAPSTAFIQRHSSPHVTINNMRLQTHQVSPPLADTSSSSRILDSSLRAATRTSAVASSSSQSSSRLQAVSKRQVAVLDGAELSSIERFLAEERNADLPTRSAGGVPRLGYLSVAAGTASAAGDDTEALRVVGVELTGGGDNEGGVETISLGSGVNLYADSVATIPSEVSDSDAISTMIASLSGVHCALPTSNDVGGAKGDTDRFVGGKVVVLGGGEYATFVADAMHCLGVDEVYLVTNNGGRPKLKSAGGVKVMGPAVGSDEVGFAESIGTFDSLVDTLSEEVPSVISELRNRHKCDRYVSTYSQSQQIIREKGILFGRDTAKKYVVDAATKSLLSSGGGTCNCIVPPKAFGPITVQKLLDGGVLYKAQGSNKNTDVIVREWQLNDFWEYTSWPRDSDGSGDTRYGLPVLDGDDNDDYDLVYAISQAEDEENDYGDSMPTLRTGATARAPNPYVMEVKGVEGLNSKIVAPGRHAVLFCSATWCRTCRSLKPKYTKIAREAGDEDAEEEEEITYAEADTTGTMGKMLSNYLDVEAVPAFVLFRSGKIYGEPLSISRLPSKKLDLAVEMLVSGEDFDSKALAKADQ